MTGEEADAPDEALLQFGDEARLSDSRLACDGDNRATSVEQPIEDLLERLQLFLAADERRFWARGSLRADPRHAEGSDRLALSLQLELAELVELEQFVDVACRRRSNNHIPKRLQARGHIDGIAERVVEDVRRRVAGRNHDRACVDGDARTKLEAVCRRDVRGVDVERLADRKRGANGALGVVVVRDRHSEKRQDAVAGQLRDGAAEALDLLPHQPYDLVEEELGSLGT